MKPSFSNNQVYGFLPTDIYGVDSLAELALDLRWSWNHAEDEIWQQLDPNLWMETHNPWVVLQNVSRDQLKNKMADQAFRKKMEDMIQWKENNLEYKPTKMFKVFYKKKVIEYIIINNLFCSKAKII